MGKLFDELKRRKVFRVAAVYAVAAWVLIQVADTVLPALQMPDWTVSFVTVLFFLGFPIAIILAWAFEMTPEGIKADAAVQPAQFAAQSIDRKLIYAILVLVILVAGFQVFDRFFLQGDTNTIAVNGPTDGNSGNTINLTRRFLIDIGVGVPLSVHGLDTNIALSPDGKRLVFIAGPPLTSQLYIQELDQLEARILPGTERVFQPFFSPDGEWVGFAGDDGLQKISIRGGAPQLLAGSVRMWGGGFWSSDDTIFYPPNDTDGNRLQRLPATGGVPELLLSGTNDSTNPTFHTWPWLLPDEDSLLFTRMPRFSARDGRIDLLTISTGVVKTLIQSGYNSRYVPTGHIVFMRAASLWAVPFDPIRLETTGPEVPVIQGVQTEGDVGEAVYTFSNDGLLIYHPGVDTSEGAASRILVWVDRDGNEVPLPETRIFLTPVVSPNGQRLAVVIRENRTNEIWIYDLTQNALSRLTFSEASETHPLWSPDGNRVVFTSNRDDGGLWWRAADGTGRAESLLTGIPDARATSFTPDGSQLVYDSGGDLFLLTLNGDTPPQPLLQTEYSEGRAAISPNGRWIAYTSNETGQFEIYVRSFPDVEGARYQISNAGGGAWPKWSSDGNELFFRTTFAEGLDGGVWAVQVETETNFQYGTPSPLISGKYSGISRFNGAFDISPDGSRFMLISREPILEAEEHIQLVVVENWFEELKRLAPPDPQ